MKFISPVVLAVALAACGGGASNRPVVAGPDHIVKTGGTTVQHPMTPEDPGKCPEVADHMTKLIGESTQLTPELTTRVHDILVTQCKDQHWSAEAQTCVLGVQSLRDNNKCDGELTKDQTRALDHAMQPLDAELEKAAAAKKKQP
jgi:hypothetical protein